MACRSISAHFSISENVFVSNNVACIYCFLIFVFALSVDTKLRRPLPFGAGEKTTTAEELRFRGDQATPPESICSHPCNASQAKKYVEGEGCCWTCVECVLYQVYTLSSVCGCK
jgi:hypothetical protein